MLLKLELHYITALTFDQPVIIISVAMSEIIINWTWVKLKSRNIFSRTQSNWSSVVGSSYQRMLNVDAISMHSVDQWLKRSIYGQTFRSFNVNVSTVSQRVHSISLAQREHTPHRHRHANTETHTLTCPRRYTIHNITYADGYPVYCTRTNKNNNNKNDCIENKWPITFYGQTLNWCPPNLLWSSRFIQFAITVKKPISR